MPKRNVRRALWGGLPEVLEERALLATITVTSLADNFDGDGQRTLREAISVAEATAEHDEIVFAPELSGVIQLQLGQFELGNSPLTITGNGRADTIIDAGGQSDIFVSLRERLVFEALTLRNARDAAVIHDRGRNADITIRDSVISGSGDNAVVIESYGDSGYRGTFSIHDSVITGNAGRGIVIGYSSSGAIENTEISDNEGGGVDIGGESDSGAPDVLISGSVFQGNSSSGVGGGIRIRDGRVTISDSRISGNSAVHGGGVAVRNGSGGSDVKIERSTITGNLATDDGGGLYLNEYGLYPAEIRNSTISGNTANRGGGIFSVDGVSVIANSTITNNTAYSEGGGISFGASLTGTLVSNIVAGNESDIGPDLRLDAIAATLFEHNFIGTNAGTNLTSTVSVADDSTIVTEADAANFIGEADSPIDPLISGLVDVGLHQVHVPLPGSPVIDHGSDPTGSSTDQINRDRHHGEQPEIGALELEDSPLRVADVTSSEGASGVQQFTFIVELDAVAPSGPFTIDARTVEGTALAGDDFVSFAQTLSFSGTAGESHQINVAVNGDTRIERDEVFLVVFENVSSPLIAAPAAVEGVIENDDADPRFENRGTALFIQGTEESDSITIAEDGPVVRVTVNDDVAEFEAGEVNEYRVKGLGGADLITTSGVTKSMQIDAGAGNDTVRAGAADDKIIGGPGHDDLDGASGNDLIFAGSGNDLLLGDAGDDSLTGQQGNDTLLGGAGSDTLRGGEGDDSAEGGDGDDKLAGDHGSDGLDGGNGDDSLFGGSGDDDLRGETGHDLLVGANGEDTMSGGADNDTLAGGNGSDSMEGGSGADRLTGGAGHDSAGGGSGDDFVAGGGGSDFLRGAVGDDSITGGNGHDRLLGQDGNDRLHGLAGNDQLAGDAGRDTLLGGPGNDLLAGGAGNDDLRGFGSGPATAENDHDTIGGGGGHDALFGEGGHDVLRGDNGADTLWGGSGDDSVDGGNGEDIIDGSQGDDSLLGGRGHDTLTGRGGNDVLLGEDGDDLLQSHAGRDILLGGNGMDSLFAGSDDDIVIAGRLSPASDSVSEVTSGQSVVDHLSRGLRDEWLSDRSYDERAMNIRDGAGKTVDRLNGTTFLIANDRPGQNVRTDSPDVDDLRGGGGLDFFYAQLGEDITDLRDQERLDELFV